MALVTIQRSPSPSTDPDLDAAESLDDTSEGRSQLRKRPKTSKEKLRRIFSSMRFLSKLRPCLSESYFTIKGAALILPHTECSKKTTKKNHGGEIQNHLQAMLNLLRPEDTIKIAVRLEDTSQFQRYIALVSTKGRQDTEEAVVLGIDCSSSSASIGLVLPMWMGIRIKLGGDGGFSLCTDELSYLFKPVSVQAMWSAIQSLYKALRIADDMNYIPDGLTHTWVGFYKSRVDSRDSTRVSQWNVEGVEIFAPSSLSIKANDSESERVKLVISQTLKEVMMDFDLDEVTSVMLRRAAEQKMGMSLAEYKSYFDEEVMRIVGQMDKPSEILEFLYLGSEWNASNLEELHEKGIGYILNVTKEIDNFFEGKFQYYNVRVYDVDESDLLKHWDKTYKFISKARSHNSKVLVHCKMGVSRSASTVMAFIMKDQRLSVDEAFQFVKERRSCVHPNSGFMEQLHTYEGILSASSKRDIFRCKSEQNLVDSSRDEAEPIQGYFLGDSLFCMMSFPEWQATPPGMACGETDISINKDLEAAESRSADSTEESMSDTPSSVTEMTTVTVSSSSATAASLPRAVPVVIMRPSAGGALSHDRAGSSEPEFISALSSSEGSVSMQLRISPSGLASRIKPDSSWIRFDTVDLEKGDVTGETVALFLCDDSSNNMPSQDTLTQCEPLPDSVGQSAVVPVSAASHLPYPSVSGSHPSSLLTEISTPARFSSDVHFYIGNSLNPIALKTATGNWNLLNTQQGSVIVSDCKQQPHSPLPGESVMEVDEGSQSLKPAAAESIVPSVGVGRSRFPEELIETTVPSVDTAFSKPESRHVPHEEEKATGLNSKSPRRKVELGVRQYFIAEKIPWKPGKVRKMQQDINKTGLISQDDHNEEKKQTLTELSQMLDVHDECGLLEQISEQGLGPSLCQSHSCVELCTSHECQPGQLSVYQREEIPLLPGNVLRLRTRLEVEDKQGPLFGEGDQHVTSSPRPVDRSCSLKLERGIPRSKYTDNRRFTTGHIMYPDVSLNDLQLLNDSDDLAKLRSTAAASSAQIEGRTEENDDKLEHRCQTDSAHSPVLVTSVSSSSLKSDSASSTPTMTSLTEDAESACDVMDVEKTDRGHPPGTCSLRELVARDSCDLDCLIPGLAAATALTHSPHSAHTGGQSCGNMVKYYVSKIEHDGHKVSSPSKDEACKVKYLSDGDTTSWTTLPHVAVNPHSSTRPTKPLDTRLLSSATGTTDLTSEALPDVSVMQSDVHQGSTVSCSDLARSGLSRLGLDLRFDSSRSLLPHKSSLGLEDVGNISLSSPDLEVQHKSSVLAERRRPESSASPGSSRHTPGHESLEPSVVRHLVGRFENRSPDSDQGSSHLSLDLLCPAKDGLDTCITAVKSGSLMQSPLDESMQLPLASASPSNRPAVSCSLQPFSSPTTNAHLPASASPSSVSSSPLLSLHHKYTSLDSALQSGCVGKNLDIPVELHELSADTNTSTASPTAASKRLGPAPFCRSSLDNVETKTWRSVRPTSVDYTQHSRSSEEHGLSSPEMVQRSKERNICGGLDTVSHDDDDDDVSLRQVSDEGRKIRRLQGKSHPLTKLSEQIFGKGPFYSSM